MTTCDLEEIGFFPCSFSWSQLLVKVRGSQFIVHNAPFFLCQTEIQKYCDHSTHTKTKRMLMNKNQVSTGGGAGAALPSGRMSGRMA
jgi:hypothetical protein